MGWFRRNEHDEEQLSAYLDGELDARHAENVERHLASCDACTALLEELRETRTLLSALPPQAPPRSFILGAEYERTAVQEVARPPKRLSLALAPAVALAVFVALLVVDVGNFTSTSSNENGAAFTSATSRQATDNATAPQMAGSTGLAPAPQSTGAGAAGSSSKASGEGMPRTAAPLAPEAASGPAQSQPDESPVAMSAAQAPAVTPAPAGTVMVAGSQAATETPHEPPASEAPASGSGGISTLRLLEIVAGAVFLASGFYVFVWPRLSRGGSIQ